MNNLPVESIEALMRRHKDIVQEFSWVTAALDEIDESPVLSAHIDNLNSYRQYPQFVYAIMPNYFETAESWFFKDYGSEFDEDARFFDYLHGHQYGSGLSHGEQLYTARGT